MTPEQIAPLVKPLDFSPRDEGYWIGADDLGVHFAVTEYRGAALPFKLEGRGGFFYKTSYHTTLAAAQAAAQSDYTARIVAALDLPALAALIEAAVDAERDAESDLLLLALRALVSADDFIRAKQGTLSTARTGVIARLCTRLGVVVVPPDTPISKDART